MDSAYIAVPGGRLYHEVEGDGPPVLLIHGGLGSLRMWDGVVPALAPRYRVIRYDSRGFGLTETDAVEFTNRADARAVLDHFGITSAVVVGQSRGGLIALDFTLEFPDRVSALVSVASGANGFQADLPEDQATPWPEMERLWDAKDWAGLAELETQVWVDGWGQPATRIDPGLRQQVHGWILETYLAQKEEGKPQSLDPPAAQRLDEVRCPLLVMVGTVDEPAGLANGRNLAASVAGAQLVEFPRVAHMIQLEAPERFNRELLDFLAEVAPRA